MNRKIIVLTVAYIGLSSVLLTAGYLFEAPFGTRAIFLLVFSVGHLLFGLGQGLLEKKEIKYFLTVGNILVLIFLENSSKYAIDYFYHALYILLLLAIVFFYGKREGIWFSILLTLASFIKFIELLIIQPNASNISMFVFFFIIQVLVLLVLLFIKKYREESQKTKALYEELLVTYQKLMDYSEGIRKLTRVEERNKLARDLHDTLGHDLTGLIMQMEMASRLFNQHEEEKGLVLLEEGKKAARESLSKVRQIVDTIKEEKEIELTRGSIQDLVREFADKTELEIVCEVQGEKRVQPDIGITIYRMVQEGLTNAVRHGKAKKIQVLIRYEEEQVAFLLKDNGIGCESLIPGNGIKGMRERVEMLAGDLEFFGEGGFEIKGKIPYKKGEQA